MSFYNRLFLIIFFSILSFSTVAANRYAIYIDAGSTGSRLHIFQYDNSFAVPDIQDVFSATVKPGLSSFDKQPALAGASLKKLLEEASAYLQKNNISKEDVTINVLATAGMRLLPESEQKYIYESVSEYIKKDNQFRLGEIKTITGEMEALYGWLDVNYLLENFQQHRPTVGSIDMGGASTQIAFESVNKNIDKDKFVINIDKQNYTVFSHSFLGLGQDRARAALLTNQNAAACYPYNYIYDQKNTGAFNFNLCNDAYQNVIKTDFNGINVPIDNNTTFIGYSGVYFSYNFFGLDQNPDQIQLEARIQSVCSKTWDDLKNNYPTIPEKYLSTYCADGIYHAQLIYRTYHIDSSKLQIKNKLNQKDIDWTLGALLYDLVK